MPSQATVTAVTGPGRQVTSKLLENVNSILYDFIKKIVRIELTTGQGPTTVEYDLAGVTVITDTITGSNHVLVLS